MTGKQKKTSKKAGSVSVKMAKSSKTVGLVAGRALTQRASQVKSSAKTGKISRMAARSAVMNISKTGSKK